MLRKVYLWETLPIPNSNAARKAPSEISEMEYVMFTLKERQPNKLLTYDNGVSSSALPDILEWRRAPPYIRHQS